MNKRELTLFLERIEDTQIFFDSKEFHDIQKLVAETRKFLERFGTLEEIINHVKELEKRVYIIKDYLTIDEATKYLQVSKNIVYRLTSSKDITYYKPNGKTIFIKRKDLEEWIGRTPNLSNSDLECQTSLLAYQKEKDRAKDKDGGFIKRTK